MSELLKTILKSLPTKNPDDYKRYQTNIKEVCGEWYTDKNNSKPPLINRWKLIKKKKTKEDKIKEKLQKVNDHWNYWKFQLHWNKLEWVYPKTRDQ